jgi:hypothetical protein
MKGRALTVSKDSRNDESQKVIEISYFTVVFNSRETLHFLPEENRPVLPAT